MLNSHYDYKYYPGSCNTDTQISYTHQVAITNDTGYKQNLLVVEERSRALIFRGTLADSITITVTTPNAHNISVGLATSHRSYKYFTIYNDAASPPIYHISLQELIRAFANRPARNR